MVICLFQAAPFGKRFTSPPTSTQRTTRPATTRMSASASRPTSPTTTHRCSTTCHGTHRRPRPWTPTPSRRTILSWRHCRKPWRLTRGPWRPRRASSPCGTSSGSPGCSPAAPPSASSATTSRSRTPDCTVNSDDVVIHVISYLDRTKWCVEMKWNVCVHICIYMYTYKQTFFLLYSVKSFSFYFLWLNTSALKKKNTITRRVQYCKTY